MDTSIHFSAPWRNAMVEIHKANLPSIPPGIDYPHRAVWEVLGTMGGMIEDGAAGGKKIVVVDLSMSDQPDILRLTFGTSDAGRLASLILMAMNDMGMLEIDPASIRHDPAKSFSLS